MVLIGELTLYPVYFQANRKQTVEIKYRRYEVRELIADHKPKHIEVVKPGLRVILLLSVDQSEESTEGDLEHTEVKQR